VVSVVIQWLPVESEVDFQRPNEAFCSGRPQLPEGWLFPSTVVTAGWGASCERQGQTGYLPASFVPRGDPAFLELTMDTDHPGSRITDRPESGVISGEVGDLGSRH
jgi:hypothetical protein